MMTMTITALNAAIYEARNAALREAKKEEGAFRYMPSRGTFLATGNADGQCQPLPEAEAVQWKGTKKEIEDMIARVIADYPECTEVYICGGYDGADSLTAYRDDDYEPWVASWGPVVVWKRS